MLYILVAPISHIFGFPFLSGHGLPFSAGAIFDSITAHFNHILSQQYPGTHIHDLRMVPGENVVNLVFDVAVPPECKDTAPLTEQLSRAAKALDPRYRCVIHYDLDFYNEQ